MVSDLIGKVFGRLTVLERAPKKETSRFAQWHCRCECGELATVATDLLQTGRKRSCGCLRRENIRRIATTHKGTGTPEHHAWGAMIQRCENESHPAYRHYGGRGITVCAAWRASFAAFLADVGPRPSVEHSLDRIDNNGPYAPGNVRWATVTQQNGNRRHLKHQRM